MTVETVDLGTAMGNLLEQSHGGVLLGILAKALGQVMDAEVSALCGANYGERSENRENQRNGYRNRPLETRLEHINLAVPKLRQGSYLPSFVEPRRRWEQAFINVVGEAYVGGVSTRKVEALIEAMGAKGISRPREPAPRERPVYACNSGFLREAVRRVSVAWVGALARSRSLVPSRSYGERQRFTTLDEATRPLGEPWRRIPANNSVRAFWEERALLSRSRFPWESQRGQPNGRSPRRAGGRLQEPQAR